MTHAQLNAIYLDMLGKHYHLSLVKPKPYQKDLGYCRIVGVALHESLDPQFEILAAGETDPEYYPVAELAFNSRAYDQGNSAITMSNTV